VNVSMTGRSSVSPATVARLVAEIDDLDDTERPSPVMVWTPEQTGQFLDFISDDRLYPLYHLIAYRGPRRGEACGVRWTDLNRAAGHLTIAEQLVQLGWAVEAGEPKSDAGGRVIALDKLTLAVLDAWRKRQIAERLAWGSAWIQSGRIFTHEDGSEWHPAEVTKHFNDLVAAASLPPIRLHDLRHGAATMALEAEVDIKVVQELLGHSTSVLTRDTYTSAHGTGTLPGLMVSLWSPKAPKRLRASLRVGRTPRSTRVRRQGLEPRTRGLRVRCSAS